MTYEEFIDKCNDSTWTLSVESLYLAIKRVLGNGWLQWYITSQVITGVAITAGLLVLSWYQGYGNLLWIPAICWMLIIGRPNISVLDLMGLVLFSLVMALIASTIQWQWTLIPAIAIPITYIGTGFRKFGYMERIKRCMCDNKVKFDEMNNNNQISFVRTA